MSKKKTDKPVIEPWDDFNEINLSKKRYTSDDTRKILSKQATQQWKDFKKDKKSFDAFRKNISVKRTKSLASVIEGFKSAHGDRYDYSKVIYKGWNKKVIIICPIHGEFLQEPSVHQKGMGCPKCGAESGRQKLFTPQHKIIEKFKKKHGNLYDYSLVKTNGWKEKVKIICRIHGVFEIDPYRHIHREKGGCPICFNEPKQKLDNKIKTLKNKGYKNVSIMKKLGVSKQIVYSSLRRLYNKKIDKSVIEPWDDFNEIDLSKKRYFTDEHLEKLRLSQSELIKRFKKVHGNKYDYSKVNYTIMREDVCIICPKHGEFFKSPYAHMRGSGCPECTKERSRKYTPEQILKMFKKVHGNRYDYSKSKITTLNTKILIICKKHGEFYKTPTYHLQGYGHPKDGYQNNKIRMKKNWSDPEIRKKRLQGIRKSWEERTRVSKKDRDKMVSLRKKKYSYKEIGKELELTERKVISAFNKYNLKELVPIDQVYKKWTPERRINHLKKFTKTLPTQSLRSSRKSNSIWNENTDTTLLNLVSKGISMIDIAKEMGLTKGQVVGRYNRLKK